MQVEKHFSWKYIPIIFIVWFVIQLGIFVFVSHNLPE